MQDQAFQIISLWMVEGDGMVVGLAVAAQDANETACFCGSLKNELLKKRSVHIGRARARQEDRVGGHLLEDQAVNLTVPFGGCL